MKRKLTKQEFLDLLVYLTEFNQLPLNEALNIASIQLSK